MLYYADKQHSLLVGETVDRVAETLRWVAAAYRERPEAPRSVALDSHSLLIGAFVSFGELHQAAADLLNPTADEAFPELDRIAESGILVGRCVSLSSGIAAGLGGASPSRLAAILQQASTAVGASIPASMPAVAAARVPEGYAFYSLYPEMYLASLARAVRFGPRSDRYTVIGIRSIGTSLATLVAGALREWGVASRVETLRPRGHPFDRYVTLASTLQQRLKEDARCGAGFVVVDEGPGLTCSSFLSVCSALSALGVPDERVAVLSAWQGRPSIYASEDSRARWQRLRVFHTDAATAFDGWRGMVPFVLRALDRSVDGNGGVDEWRKFSGPLEIEDLSYGRWRQHLYPSQDRWPVVHRPAERVKLLFRPPDGRFRLLAKFAGLGEYGAEKYWRAGVLAAEGFSPPVVGTAYGFLLQPFLPDARPLGACDLTELLLSRMSRYYAMVAHRFSLPAAPRFERLAEMVRLNTAETLSLDVSAFLAEWEPHREAIDRLPLVLVDGKPQPHEWLRVAGPDRTTYLKADSSDHARDHTAVGEQSILWDLAGACEEWEMDAGQRRRFLGFWEAGTGDSRAVQLIDFYRAAYLAFRVAELHYAIHSTDEDDIRCSLQHEHWRYRERLRELLSGQSE